VISFTKSCIWPTKNCHEVGLVEAIVICSILRGRCVKLSILGNFDMFSQPRMALQPLWNPTLLIWLGNNFEVLFLKNIGKICAFLINFNHFSRPYEGQRTKCVINFNHFSRPYEGQRTKCERNYDVNFEFEILNCGMCYM